MSAAFKYVFGPVESWRLGRSLGIDPISLPQKMCNMDCTYCQLGRSSNMTGKRAVFIPTEAVLEEVARVPAGGVDHVTFSGRGETTLASNLGEMIRGVKSLRPERVAVITNSSLLHLPEVRQDVMLADCVLAKLDAGNQEYFDKVDHGLHLSLTEIVQGLRDFRAAFRGKLAVQVMLVEENIDNACEIAELARLIGADEIQLDTPLRPSGVKPLSPDRLAWARVFFDDMRVVTVYDAPLKASAPIDDRATQARHGKFQKQST